MLRVLDLFSGIGGFSLGLERTGGFKTVAFCEIDPYCRGVLRKHWPDVPCFEDVRLLRGDQLGPVDVICGGFPCQDISTAGKGVGLAGERSGLWSEYLRLIEETLPRWVVIENVSALRSRGLDQVLREIAALGFDAEWHCIPASAVGAPHRRDRIWVVAYAVDGGDGLNGLRAARQGQQSGAAIKDLADPARLQSGRQEQWPERERIGLCGESVAAMADSNRQRGRLWNAERENAEDAWESSRRAQFGQWLAEPDVGRVAHGVPSRVDRLRALGNAVVPQIPEIIGRAILEAEGFVK